MGHVAGIIQTSKYRVESYKGIVQSLRAAVGELFRQWAKFSK